MQPENEPKGTPLVPEGDLEPELTLEDMIIPTRAELEARGENKKEDGDADDAADKNSPKEKSGDDTEAGQGDPGEQAPQAPTELVSSLEDPGEFQPGDYSFEVQVYDEDGKNPKAKKIASVDDWDALLETDPNLGSAAALLKAQRLASKMEQAQEREQAEYNAKLKAYNDEQARVDQQVEQLGKWQKQFDYLTTRGDLPKIAAKYQDADWSDPEVAKQPGVKEQLAIIDFMKKENTARRKAGVDEITSILEAFSEYDRANLKRSNTEATKQAGEQRRAAGAKVAGTTPAPVSAAPKGVMVGRILPDWGN
jgi:hypothetical protein